MDEKKSGPVRQEPGTVLEGKISDTDKLVYFTEEKVDDKGDCGFIALGQSRNSVVDVLLQISPIDDKRAQVWQEIFEAFETNRLQRTDRFEELYQLYQEPNLPEQLYQARRNAIEEYCKSEDVFKMYVEAYRDKLWLGYKSALLFAQEKKITVYIWIKDNTTNALKILDSHVEEGDGQIIHLLLTQGYSHYNLLVEAKKPTNSTNASPHIQKIPKLDSKNVAHYSFIEKTFLLSEQEMAEIFVISPKEKKELKKIKNLKRHFQLGDENNSRSMRGKELFQEISELARSAFPELKHPLLNEELKLLIANAVQEVNEGSNVKVNTDESAKKDLSDRKENKKPADPSSSSIKENKHLAMMPRSTIGELGKDNFYSIIDRLEKPMLELFEPYGYTIYKKTEDSRAFVKEDGSSLEIYPNGEIRGEVNLKGDDEAQARMCADTFIAMIMIYYEAAKREGPEKVFPPEGLNMEMDFGKSKNAVEITNLVKGYVKKELAGPILHSIKERFSFNGEDLFKPEVKNKVDSSSPLKPAGEIEDNLSDDDRETLSDTNPIPRSSVRPR